MKEMPPDLTIFLRDIGIVDDIGLQKENVSDTIKFQTMKFGYQNMKERRYRFETRG